MRSMFRKGLSLLKAAPERPEIQDEARVDKMYKYWRIRVFYSIYVGYAFYYFTRKSFTFAMPQISQELGLDKSTLGWIASLLAISYGLSKFVSGMISDRANPRYFMAIGLIATGVLNIIFGASSHVWIFVVCWTLNGWFQGFGWPPCAKTLSYWYSRQERGRWWSIWNTSHNIGAAVLAVLVGYVAAEYGWRMAMYVPGVLAIIAGIWLLDRLRDTPRSLGLPIIEKYTKDPTVDYNSMEKEKKIPFKDIIWKYILTNQYIWILAIAYFCIYVVRQAINDWTIPFLLEHKHYESTKQASAAVVFFEAGGLVGSLIAGWLSDKIFRGSRGQTNVFFTIALLLSLIALWYSPYQSHIVDYTMIFCIGMFVFGPQMLIGITAVELTHKKAAATSTGMIGWVGYLGAAMAGGPFGMLIDSKGWEGFFYLIIGATIVTLVFLSPLFSVKNPPRKIRQLYEHGGNE